ncbi:MAG: murein transglycosylase A [Proteobacteria bacterium]|nr:murein transglycosylase A [Pseudomonadota bacterium]
MRKFLIPPAAAVFLSVLAACGALFIPEPTTEPTAGELATPHLRLDATRFEKLPGWKGDDQSEALGAFLGSCAKLKGRPPNISLGAKSVQGRVSDWLSICAAAALVRSGSRTEARYFFESRFTPYLVFNYGKSSGLFTGYYEPELRGSFQPSPVFRYPIYAPPKDLVSVDLGRFSPEWKGRHLAGRITGDKIVPFATRADIAKGALEGKQLELLWVDSGIDAFFLHVQGSGRVVLPDGSKVRIGYAGRNGHRYTPIGRELVAKGVIPLDKVSLQSIRAWLDANPLAGVAMMERNKSFIFFRIIKGAGPIGAQGVVLTPGRSLAVDRTFVPLGTPVWLNTTAPGTSDKPLRRLVVAQDTGSAIKGPVRGDLFFGFGPAAGIGAGQMKEKGTYYLLLPKSSAR